MNIVLNTFRKNKTDITVFFTLTDGDNIFKWHADIPIMDDEEIQSYIETQIENYRCGIYRKQYQNAIIEKMGNETDLEAWVRWESNGCKNVTTTKVYTQPSHPVFRTKTIINLIKETILVENENYTEGGEEPEFIEKEIEKEVEEVIDTEFNPFYTYIDEEDNKEVTVEAEFELIVNEEFIKDSFENTH